MLQQDQIKTCIHWGVLNCNAGSKPTQPFFLATVLDPEKPPQVMDLHWEDPVALKAAPPLAEAENLFYCQMSCGKEIMAFARWMGMKKSYCPLRWPDK